MCLQYMIAVQKGHLAVWFHPYFVGRMLGQIIQGSDMEEELAGLGELAKTSPEREEGSSG